MSDLVFKCPNCMEEIIVAKNDINCGIFRHGVFKNNWIQMKPHEIKVNCDKFYDEELIFGCGKPFEIKKINNIFIIDVCDYV